MAKNKSSSSVCHHSPPASPPTMVEDFGSLSLGCFSFSRPPWPHTLSRLSLSLLSHQSSKAPMAWTRARTPSRTHSHSHRGSRSSQSSLTGARTPSRTHSHSHQGSRSGQGSLTGAWTPSRTHSHSHRGSRSGQGTLTGAWQPPWPWTRALKLSPSHSYGSKPHGFDDGTTVMRFDDGTTVMARG